MAELLIHSKKWGDKIVLFDDKNLEKVTKHKWSVIMSDGNFYAQTHIRKDNNKRTTIKIHQLLKEADFSKKEVIDHINGNGLDNYESNLRVVVEKINQLNRKMYKKNTTGFRGVKFKYNKYIAEISINRKSRYLGSYNTGIEAAHAYDIAAIKYRGKEAKTNFPIEEYKDLINA